MLDVPHYASLRDVTRQLVVWRSLDGVTWSRHDDVITSRDSPPASSDDDVDLVHSAADQLSAGQLTLSHCRLLRTSALKLWLE